MITLVDVSGTPRERGRQYGEQARTQIAASIGYYQEAFAASCGLNWQEVCERARMWLPLVSDFAPDLLEEVEGIAEGAGRELLEIMALNARGEIVYDSTFADLREDSDGCSSFALLPEASGDGHVYAGQNWDWRERAADSVIMLRISAPAKPTIIMQIEAGQVGRHGANSAGLALQANGLGGRFANQVGVPQPFIRRRVLESADMYTALNVLFSVRPQIANNYLFVHRDGFAIDVEATPDRHGWMYPTDGVLVHGNHYQAFMPEQVKAGYRPMAVDSLYRVPRIEQALKGCRTASGSDETHKIISGALSDHFGHPHGVCAHPDERMDPVLRWQTLTSSVVDLTTGEYRVAVGTPCESAYETLPWELY
ncbi:C45 family autoproteolytic acyltransferase/hydrolase [Nonomuraea sp. NPDC050153]|uniref:C45 family autoproteolytic acyltransferase/hydolase n=1 Tax=Nonomuraea sp. NPDC050153 TaxID=3364359 RepID=UPI00379CB5B7